MVDPPGGPELVWRPFQKSGSGRETLPEVRNRAETIREVWNWSGVTLPEVGNWSGDPLESPELVGIPSRKSGTSRDTHLEVQN